MRKYEEGTTSRRDFLDGALAAVSVTALADVLALPAATTAAPASPPACPPSEYFPNAVPVAGSVNLRKIGEITSNGTKLQAVITVRNRKQDVPIGNAQQTATAMLRYYEGHRPDGSQQWPSDCSYTGNNPPPGPGPTLRCSLGDVVQMALINRVNTADFPHTLDLVERGLENGCDVVRPAGAPTSPTPTPAPSPAPTRGPNVYPANDRFPDCLHGSSSANIHFHGTHVTPSTTGDNVLINVRPFATPNAVSERDILAMYAHLWHHCELGHQPHIWDELPHQFRKFAEHLLKEYDRTAPYAGKNANLPHDQWLWPQNKRAIKTGEWPQWYIGTYPYCFQIPPAEQDGKPRNFVMGQAPGTHWYHSHKHGSTAINLFNGMAGALIIQDPAHDGYDQKLHAFYGSQPGGLQELVLMLQQIISTPNLLTSKAVDRSATLVNGQFAPTITMRPNEVQLWRIINGCVANSVPMVFTPAPTTAAPGMTYKQTAQDGVQFAWDTFKNQDTGNNPITLAPANRADLLVQ
ncbi:MAG: multicopper oxidase domain-containing protein, partial [Mycobacteriaceae bacterium]|nr:multicopper oxidase domain-containing protein [Mycobacteriaceae bacterium]